MAKIDMQKWTIRFCALAMASGLYLMASSDEKDKHSLKIAVATSACAIVGGIGTGIANYKISSKERG